LLLDWKTGKDRKTECKVSFELKKSCSTYLLESLKPPSSVLEHSPEEELAAVAVLSDEK